MQQSHLVACADADRVDPLSLRDLMAGDDDSYRFGPFRLRVHERLLLRDEQPVDLGSRAIDLLICLVRHAGAVVSKTDLLAAAWPNTIVEESNLRVHISGLRRALGDGRGGQRCIVNVAGRGYAFVMPVSGAGQATRVLASVPHANPSLPRSLAPTYGRDDVVATLAERVAERRMVSVVGPGGIGKTTVAVAVAGSLAAAFPDGIHFVDLASITDPRLIPSTLASLLGLSVRAGDPMPQLVAFLRGRRTLVLLDNCEHLIDAAAVVAEALLRGSPDTHILATTREPLRTEGEWVYRLAALATPPADGDLTPDEILRYPAAQLFLQRATARIGTFELTRDDAAAIAEICLRLDGIPLAIELSTGMIDAFGIQGIAAHLRDRYVLMTRGRRTALPRHQTLNATLDWSHDLLTDAERGVFRKLAVFVGRFTLDSATAITIDDELGESAVLACIASLVSKSLIATETVAGIVFYRLFETTRTYALDRLIEHGEHDRLSRRHAEYFRDHLERILAVAATVPKAELQANIAPQINNVRVALDWAHASGAGRTVAVPLTIAASSTWARLLLLDEWRDRVQQALACTDAALAADRDVRMRLYAALATARLHIDGHGPALDDAWSSALAIAERIGDHDHQLSALWGLMISATQSSCATAAAYAERFRATAIAADQPTARAIGDRLVGFMLHMHGDQANARPLVERMMVAHPPRSDPRELQVYGFDQPLIGRCVLAMILLLQGFPARALSLTKAAARDAVELDHDASLFYTLSRAHCPVAIAAGDLASAEAAIGLMRERFSRHAPYELWCHAFEGMVLLRRGALGEGIDVLHAALTAMPENSFAARFSQFATDLADALSRDRRHAQALHLIDNALGRARRIEELWWEAELVRVRGEIEGRLGNVDQATASFGEAISIAARQGALLLQLRGATSLARLLRAQDQADAARSLLAPVVARFGDGGEGADLAAARSLLGEIG